MIRRTFFDADFDSELGYPDQENMTPFTIVVKVNLKQFKPIQGDTDGLVGDLDDNVFRFQDWTDHEWHTYKKEFKKEAEKYLSWPRIKLWLLPSARGKGRVGKIQILYFVHPHPRRKEFVPYLRCGLRVDFVKEEDSHVSWWVARIKDGQKGFRSFDSRHKGDRDFGMLTNQDLELWKSSSSHSTIGHELGHVLNLDHSNLGAKDCKTGNEDICYGKPGTWQYRNLMGSGNEVNFSNADPWRDRIPFHARGLDWHFTMHQPNEDI